jgi:hypothetical protein
MTEPRTGDLPQVDARRSRSAERIERLAWVMDESIRLPGGYRVGLDGFIGMIPGAGDALGMIASAYILLQGRALGATPPVMFRMFGNVMLELLVGLVPLLGDLFDFAFKANRRNVGLLEDYIEDERETHRASLFLLIAIFVLWIFACLLTMYLSYVVLRWLISLF